MKIIFCIIVMLLCTIIGILISNTYKQKITFFEEFESFLQYLNLKIAFLQDGFSECIKSFIEINNPKSDFFEQLYDKSRTGQINKEFLLPLLKNIDASSSSSVADIIYSITNLDIDGAKKAIISGISFVKDKIEDSKLQYKTKGQIYLKISICIGALICILIY